MRRSGNTPRPLLNYFRCRRRGGPWGVIAVASRPMEYSVGTGHNVCSHYGVRAHTHKLVFFAPFKPGISGPAGEPCIEPYWELFDLSKDPNKLRNGYDDPAYADISQVLHAELDRLQNIYADKPLHWARAEEIEVGRTRGQLETLLKKP